MPRQSLFRLIKRWKGYKAREDEEWDKVPRFTRGIYVLYKEIKSVMHVVYIGVAGIGKTGGGGVRARLKQHDAKKQGWTHYSVFEVHDNTTAQDIRELEALFLCIFADDPRIKLANKQKGNSKLNALQDQGDWNGS